MARSFMVLKWVFISYTFFFTLCNTLQFNTHVDNLIQPSQSDTSNPLKKETCLFDCLTWSYTSSYILRWYMKLMQSFFSLGIAWSSRCKTYIVFSTSTDHKSLKGRLLLFFQRNSIYVHVMYAWFCYFYVQHNIYQKLCERSVGCMSEAETGRVITKRKHVLSPYTKKLFLGSVGWYTVKNKTALCSANSYF